MCKWKFTKGYGFTELLCLTSRKIKPQKLLLGSMEINRIFAKVSAIWYFAHMMVVLCIHIFRTHSAHDSCTIHTLQQCHIVDVLMFATLPSITS